jgi:hypothetical protein
MQNDRLTREIAERAAEIAQLQVLLDSQSEGASAEWIAAVGRAIRDAQETLRDLQAPGGGPRAYSVGD